jgi:saccharopine dehydrogenase (NAD+, L-lysine-forming)
LQAAVIGAGAMGRVVVKDLADFPGFDRVVVADLDPARADEVVREASQLPLRRGVPELEPAELDVRDGPSLHALATGVDVVLNAAQHYVNLDVMDACLAGGAHYCDLGGLFWTTQAQLDLHDAFQRAGKTAILGIGSTPGISNVMCARAGESLERLETVSIRSGGRDPHERFQAPYSIDTILDELSLEPMVLEDGNLHSVRPLSGREPLHFRDPVGEVIGVFTLHSELATVPQSYRDRGVRDVTFKVGFPESFLHKLVFLTDLGFAGADPIRVDGVGVSPRAFLAALLRSRDVPARAMDWDALDVTVRGAKDGMQTEVLLQTLVGPSARWNEGGGAVQTAVPLAIVARMLSEGAIQESGVFPPERVVAPGPLFSELEKRGVSVTETWQD